MSKPNNVANNTINDLAKYGVDADKVIKEAKNILKKALLELKEEVLNGEVEFQYLGICGNLEDKIEKYNYVCAYSFVVENCKGWQYFCGSENYPVPNSKESAVKNESCWDTPEKVNYRLSLIEHLLTKVS